MTPPRRLYLMLALATIAVGLAVHKGGAMLPPALRDVAGDALWATMMVWWISALTPSATTLFRAGVATVVCMVVESSQLLHVSWLDAIRRTTLGHLALGSDFDTRDLAAYVVGVVLAILMERALSFVSHGRATDIRT